MNMKTAYIAAAVDIALWGTMLWLTWHYVTCPVT